MPTPTSVVFGSLSASSPELLGAAFLLALIAVATSYVLGT